MPTTRSPNGPGRAMSGGCWTTAPANNTPGVHIPAWGVNMTRADQTHWAPGTSRRTVPLPRGWKKIRAAALHRDGHQCTEVVNGIRCPNTTQLEVDHLGDPDDHTLDNLATRCKPHHASKTGRQARAVQLARRTATLRRAQRPHPGLTG